MMSGIFILGVHPKPPPLEKELDMSVLQALLDAQLALLSHSNCLITDRPDLPRAPDTGWTTDFTRELAAIDAAIFALTGDLRKCPECGRCSTSLSSVPTTSPTKCQAEHPCSRKASGGCS